MTGRRRYGKGYCGYAATPQGVATENWYGKEWQTHYKGRGYASASATPCWPQVWPPHSRCRPARPLCASRHRCARIPAWVSAPCFLQSECWRHL